MSGRVRAGFARLGTGAAEIVGYVHTRGQHAIIVVPFYSTIRGYASAGFRKTSLAPVVNALDRTTSPLVGGQGE